MVINIMSMEPFKIFEICDGVTPSHAEHCPEWTHTALPTAHICLSASPNGGRTRPVAAYGLTGATKIAAGDYHTLAIKWIDPVICCA